jgi:hypothetical protein
MVENVGYALSAIASNLLDFLIYMVSADRII